MTACIFCEIATYRAPAAMVDTKDFDHVAFVPLNPVTPGHLLVIPRFHAQDAIAHPGHAGRAMTVAGLVAMRLGERDPRYESVNFITSVGMPATQSVFHLHIHIVPRREGDGLQLPWTETDR
ncbi:histidine triad nucleotide binding protein [Microbacterium phage Casend]|nr:histidine triad nucleotide binding protein [Microbacterium phage Casend]WNM75524.1 histidine triad nucleotide binding protein [Microbacterium phage Wayne3]